MAHKAKHRVTIDDVHLVYKSSMQVTGKKLDVLERELGAELPRGYRTFLTRFGHGWVNDWLQIYCPDGELMREQRDELVRRFGEYTRDGMISFCGAKLTEDDINTCIQIGINQDVMRIFACRRFPGSAFKWDGLNITQLKTGIEVLDPFGMRVDGFAYFMPLEPVPTHRSLACQSKKLEVSQVVRAIEELCKGSVRVIDVNEGPGQGARTPAVWLFPQFLGVKFHVYGVETNRDRRVYLTFATSPKLLPKVEPLIEAVSIQLAVRFKPARWH